LVENDRIIGGMTKRASEMAIEMYKMVVKGDCVITDSRTAEMCKLTENSSRDVSIAFANELSIICDKFGIDVRELISLANRHPRVDILQPGSGVGGHCIAVDPWFIVASAPEEAKLIRMAREGNDAKPKWVVQKGKDAIMQVLAQQPEKSMSDIKVACLGLSFKPDIDDLRESPAMLIAQGFADLGCQILAVEPNIDALPSSLSVPNVSLVPLQTALEQADVVCALVKHTTFLGLKSNNPLEGSLFIDAVGL
jgi:UDP-N-acetyl-D-mannosaminuronic acid dehydrogenase